MGKELMRLRNVLQRTLKDKQDVPKYIAGLLGIFKNGAKVVKVPGRPGYVYVRVAGNESEILEAINTNVPTTFNTKVLVSRTDTSPSVYVVIGRDLGQYDTYADGGASFIPKHGSSHSFGNGSDPTFIYRRQMVQPLLPRPTNPRTMAVYVEPDFFIWNSAFQYWGGGNSPSLTSLKPTDGIMARYVTIFLEGSTNTIQVMTGTDFLAVPYMATGVYYYIPEVDPAVGIPLAAVLLYTGTTSVEWTDIKDLRMFLGGGSINSVGGFITGSVPFAASDGTLTEDNSKLHFDGSRLIAGYFQPLSNTLLARMQVDVVNDFAGMTIAGIYTGVVSPPFQTLVAMRGTPTNIQAIISGSNLGRMNWTGSITGTLAPSPPVRVEVFATSDWNGNATPAILRVLVTATGTTSSVEGLRVNPDSIDIVGKRFKLSGDMTIVPTGAVSGKVLGYDGTQWIPADASGITPGTYLTGIPNNYITGTHSHWKHRYSAISGTTGLYLSGVATFIEFVSFNGFIIDPDTYALGSGSTYCTFISPLNTNGILTINFTR